MNARSQVDPFLAIRDAVMEVERRAGQELGIDEDWSNTLYLWNDGDFYPCLLDPRFFNSGSGKDIVSKVIIPGLIKKYKAKILVLVNPIWFVEITRPAGPFSLDDIPTPKEHPYRKEALMMLAADQHRAEHWRAEVRRLQNSEHPVLLKWEQEPEDALFEGRFIQEPLAALRGLS